MPTILNDAFCPRCDKKYSAPTKMLAWGLVMAHIKRKHPEYVERLDDI